MAWREETHSSSLREALLMRLNEPLADPLEWDAEEYELGNSIVGISEPTCDYFKRLTEGELL